MRGTDKNTADKEKGEAEKVSKPSAAEKRLIRRKLS
jgi:hypothetical protein